MKPAERNFVLAVLGIIAVILFSGKAKGDPPTGDTFTPGGGDFGGHGATGSF